MRNTPAAGGARQGYEELRARSSEVAHAGVIVRIASLDDIVASKEWANRPKDQWSLPELYAIQRSNEQQPRPPSRSVGPYLDRPGGRRPPQRGVERD